MYDIVIIYGSTVRPILTYGAEVIPETTTARRQTQVDEMKSHDGLFCPPPTSVGWNVSKLKPFVPWRGLLGLSGMT